MPDNKNNDVINDILNQLDNEKKKTEAESAKLNEKAEEKPVEKVREASSKPDAPRPVVSHRASPLQRETSAQSQRVTRNEAAHSAEKPAAEAPRRPAQRPPMGGDAVPVRNSAAVKRNNTHHKKKKKKRRSRLPGVLILTVSIFAVSICLSMVIIAFGRDMLGIGKSDATKLIIVPEGATTEQISELLHDEGIINSPKCFQMFTKLRKKADIYLPGEHFVSPNMAYETIIDTLTNEEKKEDKEAVTITFREGINIFQAAQLLEEEGVCKSGDFLFQFNSGGFGYRFESELPQTPNASKFADARMEGYLFPDTYTFTKEMEPEQVCQKIYFNFDQKMTDERLAKMKQLGLTLDQLIIMASIVQQEAPNREDMNHVAGVFWNRLEKPEETAGKLQSDPTKNYAYDVIRPRLAVANKEMLDAYDTYVCVGLPPGAICNPGLYAIDAVLEKMPTEDFYFIANIYTQETFFSKTYEEHAMKTAQVKADEQQYEIEEAERKEQEELAAMAEEENG
ncbi:endolytic transglycosylase MltG [Ruminococcus flavefaciens]|uniref:endolytic transglycosylase MltG n=1 Tax=Ruminococcus flavefaciens TaxID=1265 RepID=UPI0006848A70|nr:endolytic transglycosylase MltG [Ruminococcus flavefaciens]